MVVSAPNVTASAKSTVAALTVPPLSVVAPAASIVFKLDSALAPPTTPSNSVNAEFTVNDRAVASLSTVFSNFTLVAAVAGGPAAPWIVVSAPNITASAKSTVAAFSVPPLSAVAPAASIVFKLDSALAPPTTPSNSVNAEFTVNERAAAASLSTVFSNFTLVAAVAGGPAAPWIVVSAPN